MMNTKNKIAVLGLAAGFALNLVALPLSAADTTRGHMGSHQRLGRLEKSDQIIGSDLKNKQNQSLGKIDDLVVDLESGHILFAIVSVDGNNVALAPEILSP